MADRHGDVSKAGLNYWWRRRAIPASRAQMFACDLVLANRDRHYGNFSVIRNMETLEVVRLAPVFDSGSCLWSNAELLEAPIDFEYKAKPFKHDGMKPADQVRLFEGHFSWFDAGALDGFASSVAETLRRNPNIPFAHMPASRPAGAQLSRPLRAAVFNSGLQRASRVAPLVPAASLF